MPWLPQMPRNQVFLDGERPYSTPARRPQVFPTGRPARRAAPGAGSSSARPAALRSSPGRDPDAVKAQRSGERVVVMVIVQHPEPTLGGRRRDQVVGDGHTWMVRARQVARGAERRGADSLIDRRLAHRAQPFGEPAVFGYVSCGREELGSARRPWDGADAPTPRRRSTVGWAVCITLRSGSAVCASSRRDCRRVEFGCSRRSPCLAPVRSSATFSLPSTRAG